MPQNPKGVILFGITEIFMGSVTLISTLLNLELSLRLKPLNVFIFVVLTAIISLFLGIGILKHNLFAYRTLMFFAGAIILSKILIFAKIITLSGELETAIPQSAKNLLSILYHSSIIWYFNLESIKKYFEAQP